MLLLSINVVVAYDPQSRWGQAVVLVNDVLFVHGGKTDQYNSYSYNSAPNTNDILYLPLSGPFAAAQPPWELVSSSTNLSTSQGPAVSWHTLSAFNKSGVLLFGGQPGPNSPTVVVDQADSASLLNVFDQLEPVWQVEPPSWGDQPTRRIHHTSSTSLSGIIYIIGGQLADGSDHTFSEHYMFDPQTLRFSRLPSDGGPPAIYGHVSVMFTDGRLFVFGGVTGGSLSPFSTIWVLDTTKNPLTWASLQVDPSSVPTPRRAFAAVAIDNNKILIQGGSDINLQTNLDNGWILDVSKNPAVWTSVDALTQVGLRRDHFAVFSNGQVIFGFGYLNSGPAPALLQIYDPSSNSYSPSYTPLPLTATPTPTMPGPTGTPHNPGSPTMTHSGGGVHPTSTAGPGGSGDNGGKKTVTGIVLGTTLGLLCALAAGTVIVIYSRRRRRLRDRRFMTIGGDEDGGNSSLHAGSIIPAATRHNEKGDPGPSGWAGGLIAAAFGIAGTVGAVAKSRNARDNYQRRDMLADEDTREFGEWYGARRRDGTGGSSWSLNRILGARFRSREPSIISHGSHRHERTDPFSDGASLVYNEDPMTPGNDTSMRPHNRRQTSYFSTGSRSYIDPFADPIREDNENETFNDLGWRNNDDYEPTSVATIIARPPPSFPIIHTVLPVSLGGHPLSPLSEHTSKTSLPSNDHNTSSHAHSSDTPFDMSLSHITSQTTVGPSSRITSKSSVGSPQSSPLVLPSLVPASSPQPNVRRSDSWWSKFYRTGFLDRSLSSRRSGIMEIRDPNPPPALGPIRESMHSTSVDDSSSAGKGPKDVSAARAAVYGADPGKSLTSLRTADTEQIDRMAGTMDVVQRIRTHSRQTTESISSGLSSITHETGDDGINGQEELTILSSPVEMVPGEGLSSKYTRRLASPSPIDPPLSAPFKYEVSNRRQLTSSPFDDPQPPYPTSFTPISSPTSPSVAARVQNYERRMSQDQGQPLPTNTKQWEERTAKKDRVTINYGLAPRASLFVANPDHRNSRSSDS